MVVHKTRCGMILKLFGKYYSLFYILPGFRYPNENALKRRRERRSSWLVETNSRSKISVIESFTKAKKWDVIHKMKE